METRNEPVRKDGGKNTPKRRRREQEKRIRISVRVAVVLLLSLLAAFGDALLLYLTHQPVPLVVLSAVVAFFVVLAYLETRIE
jgi:hypothetical protein